MFATMKDRRPRRDAEAAAASTDAGPTRSISTVTEPSGEESPTLLAGAQLGRRYRVTRMLGRGGMGDVYLAFDEMLGQEVALKVLRPRSSSNAAPAEEMEARQREALRREVLIAQRVTHRNVCRTYDLEEIDGLFLIKMEHVAGTTLTQLLATRSRLTVEETLDIARQVTAGLEAAHAQGVIHCDLKPDNIFIEKRSGRAVLMDFGIARAQVRGDEPGKIAGTPAYMSPEQARGGRLDVRSDLYSLGCVLYHALGGAPPYPAFSPAESLEKRAARPRLDLEAELPTAPPWLRAVIARLLTEERDKRYRNSRELLRALAGPRRKPWRFSLRTLGAGVLLGGVLLGLGGLGWSTLRRRRGHEERAWRPVVEERLPAYEEAATPPTLSPDGQWLAYATDRDGPPRVYVEPAIPGSGGRGRHMDPPGPLTDHPLRWTRDGRALLYVDTRSRRAYRMPLDGSTPDLLGENVVSMDDCAGRLAMAFTDRSDRFRIRSRLVLRDMGVWSGGQEHQLAELPPGHEIQSLRCSPQGLKVALSARLVAGQEEQDLWVVPIDGSPAQRLTTDHQSRSWPLFDADGSSVIFASRRGGSANLWEIPLTGGATLQLTSGAGPDVPGDVAPDGQQLYFQTEQSAVQIYARNLRGGEVRPVTHTLDSYEAFSLTPDERSLVASVTRGGHSSIVLVPFDRKNRGDGGEERLIAEGDLFILTLDGSEVIYTDLFAGATRLRAVPLDGGPMRELGTVPGHALRLFISPSGPSAIVRTLQADAGKLVTWRMPLAGGSPEREDLRPYLTVQEIPRSGWRVAFRPSQDPGQTREMGVFAPGVPLTAQPQTTLYPAYFVWQRDGTAFIYATDGEVRRYHFATARDELLFYLPTPIQDLDVSADGKTVYFGQGLRKVRRYTIPNFGGRHHHL